MSLQTAERLAYMARQIADFFRAYPHEQAAASVAAHINQFWTPRMRADLLALPPADLDPLVVSALPQVKPAKD